MDSKFDLHAVSTADATVSVATTTENKIKPRKTFADLPIELRFMIFEYVVTNRTPNTSKDPLASLSLVTHSLRNQITYWLQSAPSVRRISWAGYFNPEATIFAMKERLGESSGLDVATKYRVFCETVQHILLDIRGQGSFHGEFAYGTIAHFRCTGSLKRLDIRRLSAEERKEVRRWHDCGSLGSQLRDDFPFLRAFSWNPFSSIDGYWHGFTLEMERSRLRDLFGEELPGANVVVDEEEVDWLVADVENERRDEEWKREQRRLKREHMIQKSAVRLEKDRARVCNKGFYFRGQRLKGRWEVKGGR
ncbi:hypothetical protein DL98DRAFT_536845 [Cadophora sp. DSE1049]|nr:hypothetical protein DL98DRAFT_536845 [Cadophora sp. DSE1049]